MNRQNYQQIGFVIALIIAGVSLPTSIISLTREPTIITNTYNNVFYEDNTTKINTVSTIPHNIIGQDWEAVVFDYLEGDKIIAVWSCFDNTIDVFFMNAENYQLFINGSISYITVLSMINTSYGFFEYTIIEPDLYFTVFFGNYSNAWTSYQVSHYSL